jgi:hypothetical protein
VGLRDIFGRRRPQASDEIKRELLRHYEILKDCEDLINTSPDFSVVLRRFDLLLDELGYFAAYEVYGVDYLERYGISFKTPASSLWKKTFDGRAEILNNAVDRLLDVEIDRALTLKTKSGQENRLLSFVDKIQSEEGVPMETMKYVASLPVLDALREPKVVITCKCGHKFKGRPHAYQRYLISCPKCRRQLRVDTSGADL